MSKRLPLIKRPDIIYTSFNNKINKNIKLYNDYSSETRWLNKKVIDQNIIFNKDNMHTIITTDNGLWKKLEDENKVILNFKTDIKELKERKFCTFSFIPMLNNWESFNRFYTEIYINSVGYQNFYFHFEIQDEKGTFTHAYSLIPNQINKVNFEFDHNARNNVQKVAIGVLITGCPPEALPNVEVTFKEIYLQKVKEDYTLGWNLEERFAFSHIGYYPKGEKIITTSLYEEEKFNLYDKDGKKVYSNNVKQISNLDNNYVLCDFSDFEKEGEYYLQYGKRKTNNFIIDKDYLDSSVLSSLNFLYSLRCGEDIKGVHSPCHLNSYAVDVNGNKVPVFGGWHDAGDVSQFEICTGEMAHALMDLADEITNEEHKELLLSEARVGLNWLLRTRFGNGYRVMGVTYSIWRDNVLRYDTNNLNEMIAERGAFENLISASCLAKGYQSFKNIDLIFANWCKRAAIEDFNFALEEIKNNIFTKRWGKVPDAILYGEAILSSVILYEITEDYEYIKKAKEYANIVMSCQQQDYPLWDIPVRGFFYENPDHLTNLVYEHRGHFDACIYGLTKLCEICQNEVEYPLWINTLKLYEEYILTITKYTSPYNLLPAGIYELNKINLNSYTIHASDEKIAMDSFIRQIKKGIKLNDGVYLRKMAVSVSRRGFHATMLSMAKAVSRTAVVLKSEELMKIVIKQVEWIFGNNPFASSTMYGEGYNYHPLYVAFSSQIIGALPVGIKTFKDSDEPYWPTIDNAVFKEIWGHTTGKYLWVLSDLIKYNIHVNINIHININKNKE